MAIAQEPLTPNVKRVDPIPLSLPVIWATEVEGKANAFKQVIRPEDFHQIIPRVEKSKEEQKRRVKAKAEVFTPSWVCNLQNNLIDDELVYPGAFNTTEGPQSKTWTGTSEPVKFKTDKDWVKYVVDSRLEMTMGEAPYLVSRYDATTGNHLPIQDEDGAWTRIGLLDRKLRVVTERCSHDKELWDELAYRALWATYGFEWQGDNLLLARLNILNTMVDYHVHAWDSVPSEATLRRWAELIVWNFWQMDGLKMVQPESCSASCGACLNKKRGGHDGKLSLITKADKLTAFETLLPQEMHYFPKAK